MLFWSFRRPAHVEEDPQPETTTNTYMRISGFERLPSHQSDCSGGSAITSHSAPVVTLDGPVYMDISSMLSHTVSTSASGGVGGASTEKKYTTGWQAPDRHRGSGGEVESGHAGHDAVVTLPMRRSNAHDSRTRSKDLDNTPMDPSVYATVALTTASTSTDASALPDASSSAYTTASASTSAYCSGQSMTSTSSSSLLSPNLKVANTAAESNPVVRIRGNPVANRRQIDGVAGFLSQLKLATAKIRPDSTATLVDAEGPGSGK